MELKYFLVALLGALTAECNAISGQALPNRPIVLGPLVGLILGDVVQGTIIGATLELSYMGVMVIGISSAVNMTVASLLGTTYAMVTGSGPEVAVALAIPCSLLYSMVGRFYGIFRMWLVRIAAKDIETGDIKKFERWHWLLYGARFVTSVPTYFIALLLGSTAVQGIVDAVPKVIMDGLQAGTMLLPALGFAMLVNLCWTKEVAAFYFIGFVLSIYAGLDNIAIAILSGAFAVIAFFFIKEEGNANAVDTAETEVAPREHLLDKKTLTRIYWRSYTLEASFNSERFQGLGFGYMMVPAIEKLYSDPEDRKEALIRQCEFFNTTPTIVTLITGIVCAMEEEKSQGTGMTGAAISNVKVALMGPSAGIGDAIFWGSYRIICASIACQLGINGNVLAPFVFLFLFNIPNVLIHWYGLFMSYEVGSNFIKRMYQSNVMDKITLCCGIMGMTMIGAMTASLVSVKTPFILKVGGIEMALQETLDSILPGMLSLITVFAISRILKKQVSVMSVMLGILVVGIAGRLLGIL